VPRRKSRTLTEVELEFMDVVWDEGEVTTEAVQNALRRRGRPLSDGSVRKVLSILETKGYLDRRQEGRGFLYWATVDRDQARRGMIKDLVDRAFDGSASLMVAALINSKNVGRKELAEIQRLVDRREREEER
jgi:predicted transcriptional regulator